MTRRVLLPMCLLLGACARTPAETEGGTQGLIVDGTPSTSSQDATVLLALGTDGGFCTGALIAPNLVLTARHCVQEVDVSEECSPFTTRLAPSTITVALGVAPRTGAFAARGKQTFVDLGTDICSHDIALILLDRDVSGARIATLRLDEVQAGETTTTVGYGDDGSGTPTNGRFQRTSLEIDAVGPTSHTYTTATNERIAFTVHAGEIATGESTCFGDSGGPLFDADGSIIGVTSRGLDEQCIDRPSIFSDTASHAKLIAAAAEASGYELSIAGAGGEPADPGDDAAADDEDDGTANPKSKTKSGSMRAPRPNAGCALAAPARESRDGGFFLVVALVALVAVGARRRRGTP